MSKGSDLLDRMRRTSSGWGADDFRRLYEAYGFDRFERAKHTIYRHPDYPSLRATVARHTSLSDAYAKDAVAIVEQLLQYTR